MQQDYTQKSNEFYDAEAIQDKDLISLALEKPDYFSYVVKRYENKLNRYIKRISGLNNEDAEDLLQDIFIKVYKNLNNFDKSLKFSSWIYRIAHNEVISQWRKLRFKPQTIGGEEINEFLHNIASETDINKDIENKELSAEINIILNKLDIKYREVLILRFLEEKDYREISDIIKKPMGTVATLVNRAKKQFKKEAEKMGIKFI